MKLNNLLSSIFGNKAQRDMNEIIPWVNKINSVYPQIKSLSNDQLREQTEIIKQKLANIAKNNQEKIITLKKNIETVPLEKREELWNTIDTLEKEITLAQEKMLDEVLPETFAIMKDTARRFTQNSEIIVTANDFDRKLAANHNFIQINGDKAIYHNHWMAGGNEITWDMIHYDVQLFGGVVLHNHNPKKYDKDTDDPKLSKRVKGYIAEMATGEGKTLVATLPVFLNALTHNGVHIVTVNEYLAKRDSEWMGPLYMFHGLSVDCIDKHKPNSEERRKAYEADITFGTNNEFGFDYLRDNMALNPKDLVQRKHNYVIVDEVDSVLIDDARTPLIISGPVSGNQNQHYEEYRDRVINIVSKQKTLTTKLLAEAKQKIGNPNQKINDEGYVLLFRSYKGMPKNKALIKYLSEPGVKAGMLKTEEFYMQQQNKEMHIITDELYFVIDEKNNTIDLTDKGIDLLTGHSEDPLFFVLPKIGTQIAEIEQEGGSDEEIQTKKDVLLQDYAVKSDRVHTVNQLLKAYCLFEKDDEYVVIDNKVKIVDEQTGRIMDGRRYSDGLHQAIEAKENVKVEAATKTFATITLQNYFRMYRKLAGMTGTAETEAGEFWDIYKLDVVVIPTNRPIIRNDMNDRIYKTAREKYKAVIQEIINLKNAGRPVLVGTTSVEISELLSRMLTMQKIPHNVLNAKLHRKEADIIAQAGQSGTVTIATNMAGRGTDIKLSPEVRKAGGLAIIGTERHESRRVDRQLRGRSGRQGDPGSSVFFISLEDELMRLFATERIAGMMDRMGFKEGEMLEAKMLNSAVERAQKKVEENNYGIRKRLLEYDDVMNLQRKVVYARRRHALIGERIGLDVQNMLYDTAANICEKYIDADNYEGLRLELFKTMAMEIPFDEKQMKSMKPEAATETVFNVALENFKRKTDKMAQTAHPVIKQVYEQQGGQYENIVVPITDGKQIYNVQCNLKEAYESESKDIVKAFEKAILLHFIDETWIVHLWDMDDLRHSVQNVSYENKDPLLIYKLESFDLFKKTIDEMNRKSASVLMRGQIPVREPEQVRQATPERKTDYSNYRAQKDEITENRRVQGNVAGRDTREQQVTAPIRASKTVGRNEQCPCGSGKKYKNCHGRM
ncbi:MAG: preprotein translocase subunit SecA [Dysgonamonadaceae bacterium]|nr:preprotein translocase subunit SecA [Dysgonamonadaceae bacterium]